MAKLSDNAMELPYRVSSHYQHAKHDSAVADMLAAGFELQSVPEHEHNLCYRGSDSRFGVLHHCLDSHDDHGHDPALSRHPVTWPAMRKLLIRHDESSFDISHNITVDVLVLFADGAHNLSPLFQLRIDPRHRDVMFLSGICDGFETRLCSTRPYVPQKSKMKLKEIGSRVRVSASATMDMIRIRTKTKEQARIRQAGVQVEEEVQKNSSCKDDACALSIDSSDDMAEMLLEFANYAHVRIRRIRTKRKARYKFSYWGEDLHWDAVDTICGSAPCSVLQLRRSCSRDVVARIEPSKASFSMTAPEGELRGQILPSWMQILDPALWYPSDITK